ncbi:MAG: hypothetical protein V1704_02850 [Candidatus Vogelbacteria bacterium]
MFQICKALVDEVLAQGGTDADLRRIQTDATLRCKLANLIVKKEKGVEAKLIPPPGGRLQIVRVPVDPQRDWQEAINVAGPNTPASYNVRKVGNLYLPTAGAIKDTDMILMNFGPNRGSWNETLAWGKANNLKLTVPRQVFAIGEHHPQLHKELGMDPMYVVATTECTFGGSQQACDVWWGDAGREAGLYWVSDYGSASGWFAFVRLPDGKAGKSSGLGN